MKKIFSIILVICALMTMSAFAADEITVEIDGVLQEYDVAPRAINGRVMVPMRKIFETLGAEVQWDGTLNKVTAVKGDVTVELILGSVDAKIGEKAVVLDSAPQAFDGRTLVPIRFVSEALGAKVDWDGENNKVIIKSKAIKVFASLERTAVLKADGTVILIGAKSDGQYDVSEWTDIKDVSVDDYNVLGLKNDGTVLKVGGTDDNQYDVTQWNDIVCISTSGDYAVGLKADGTVVAAGHKLIQKKEKLEVGEWKDITEVCAGLYVTAGLKADGTVVITEAGNKYNTSDWKDITAISLTKEHILGLKANGTVVCTGYINEGQGNVQEWNNIVAISAGKNHSVGLKADGTVVAAGNNGYGQCNVSEWTDIIAVAAGQYHTVGLKADGTVVATGQNRNGECDVDIFNE